MKELFATKMSPYDLRNNNSLKRRSINSVRDSTESVSYLGPKIWDLVPSEIKTIVSASLFFKKTYCNVLLIVVNYK